MTSASEALERLSPESLPTSAWQPDWRDVLARAGAEALVRGSAGRRRLRWRHVMLIAATVTAVVVPLVALAENDWWFLKLKGIPRPVSTPVVVAEGSWSGHPWQLVAYQSYTEGTCWTLTFNDVPRSGWGGVRCGSTVGVGPLNGAFAGTIPTIAYAMGGSFDGSFPSWIAGPVVRSAATVVIRWRNGAVVQTSTVSAKSLGEIGWFRPVNFYAVPLPDNVVQPSGWADLPQSLTGLDARGRVVACLVVFADHHGWSPLSECER
jgi:hypothetical protein